MEPLSPASEIPFETFGAWVKSRRNALDWSQAKLAGRAYCSIDTIRAIEQQRANYRPSLEMAERLATCLEIPASQRAQFIALARAVPQNNPTPAETILPNAPTIEPPFASAAPAKPRTLSDALAAPVFSQLLGARQELGAILTKPLAWLLGMLLLVCALIPALGIGIPMGLWILTPGLSRPTWAGGGTSFIVLQQTEPRVKVEANGKEVASGNVIPRGTQVIVTFVVTNSGAQPTQLASIEIGARGPCAKRCDWNSPIVQFAPQQNVTLTPGTSFTYRASRVLTEPGIYFVEPVMRDLQGRYGGIRPFTRIEFRVGDATSDSP